MRQDENLHRIEDTRLRENSGDSAHEDLPVPLSRCRGAVDSVRHNLGTESDKSQLKTCISTQEKAKRIN
jgi:hypothetical protein